MVRSGSPRAPRVLLPAVLVLGLSAGPALAQGTPEQREACTPDALKLCQDTIPDVARTEACMKRHEAELSPRCHAAFLAPPAGSETRHAARAAPGGDRLADTGRRRAAPDAAPPEDNEEPPPRRLGPEERRHVGRDTPGENEPGGDGPGAATRRLGPPAPDAREAGGPPDSYDEPPPGSRRFGPPGPYGGYADGGPPDGYDEPWPGPRGYGPPGPGPYGGRFADGGPPDGYDGPGPRGDGAPDRGHFADRGPPDGREPPDVHRYHYGPPDAAEPGPHGGRRARMVLRRLCAQNMIDPRTCALVRRALAEGR